MLQRSANPDYSSHATAAVADEGHRTPTKEHPEIIVHPSSTYPTLSSASSPGSDGGDAAASRELAEEADRREEAWVENIRVIEALRRLISERLERREYEDDADADADVAMSGTADEKEPQQQSRSLYPVLRADD
jgi:hypothetical protein